MPVILGIKIEDRSLLHGLARSQANLRKQVMGDTARFWHERILQRHFEPSARFAYGYARRSRGYEARKRREGGRFMDLVLTGQSRRWLLERAEISQTSGRVTIRMRAPWYFKNPNGQIVNARGKRFASHHQPDKPDEVTRVNQRDRTDLREYSNRRFADLLLQARASARRVVHVR